MFVRCHRCSTDYEFDDALISERGTLVRCTNCDEQFKVYPPDGAAGPERWVVRTASGRELVYTSLRELQRAISVGHICAEDTFTRGRLPPRALGSVAELKSFFPSAPSARVSSAEAIAPPSMAPPPSEEVPAETAAHVATPAPVVPGPDETKPEPPKPPPPSRRSPRPARETAAPEKRAEPALSAPTVSGKGAESEISSPRLPLVRSLTRAEYRGSTAAEEQVLAPYPLSASEHVQHARSRWIAGVVLLALVALVSLTVGRRYLTGLGSARSAGSRNVEPRIKELLESAARRSEEGDFEGAKEQLDKAAALSERDPAVLVAALRLETLRADILWLKLRLTDPSSAELVQASRRELNRRLVRAKSALEAAFAVTPEALDVVRSRIDLLRMAGETQKAREWVTPLGEKTQDADNAYVLGLLDLAEGEPAWASAIERLRIASSAELESGRAHAALIWALVRAQRTVEAEVELSKLESSPRPHILLDDLRGFVKRNGAAFDGGWIGGDRSTASRVGLSSDIAEKLEHARALIEEGNLSGAGQLFRDVTSEQPNNFEAWTGLGDVAVKQRDEPSALRFYEQALELRPNYVPALMARADLLWSSGERKLAATLYRRALAHVAAGSDYAERASLRAAPAPESRPQPLMKPVPKKRPPELKNTAPGSR